MRQPVEYAEESGRAVLMAAREVTNEKLGGAARAPEIANRPIGFGREIPVEEEEIEVVREDVLLEFDSGRRFINFADAAHHMLVLGTTGSGKTESVIFPVLYQLVSLGCAGLLIDVKGNLRSKSLALIRDAGRENYYLELGTSLSAQKLNILKGWSIHTLRAFFEAIIMDFFDGESTNKDWVMRGVMQTVDCVLTLFFLSQKYPEFDPNIRLVLDMLESPAEAVKIYNLFKSRIYDPNNIDHERLKSSVENNHFHVLKTDSEKRDHTFDEQQTWNLNTARSALRAYLETPGIESNFCCQGAPGIDMASWLCQGKLVVLRFDLDSGKAGRAFSRLMIEAFYAAVRDLGLLRFKERKFFICIDEFQEVCDLSNNRFSDTNFISVAREFNCAFIAATQSMAALIAKGQTGAAVDAFVANCNQRILLYQDDPVTQEVARRYDPDIQLSKLKRGEAFAITYKQQSRKHEHGIETLNKAFSTTHDLVSDVDPYDLPVPATPAKNPTIFDLRDAARSILNGTYRRNKVADNNREDQMNDALDNMPEGEAYAIYREFSQFFDPDADPSLFCVPIGWISRALPAFRVYARIGLPLKITRFRVTREGLRAETGESDKRRSAPQDAGVAILNELLRDTDGCCVICGARINSASQDDYDEDSFVRTAAGFICQSCVSQSAAPRC
ncbi:MAG: hypothetical protein K2H64_00630 [Desulfovibrio sp.]|nr:hypothetical protein [Desulfovibrio sp.]